MSLKAKIEAVIYASEEPVTLAQLVGLLGQEGQAELDRLEDRQGSLGLDGDGASGEALGDSEESGFPQRTQGNDAEEREGGLAEGGGYLSSGEAVVDAERAVELRSIPHPFDEAERMGHPEQATATEEADSSAALRNDNQNALRDDNQNALGNENQGGEEAAAEVVAGAAEKRVVREKERRLREFFREILDGLMREYATGDRGLEVREVAGGFRMATKPEYHDAVRGFVRGLKPVLKLSLQALETLAVVAYKQPVTAPEVSEIRGVDSGGVLGNLMGRKLVTTAGRKQVIGRPILYKTTKDFLLRFGLRDIGELPSIEEFEKLAGELVEQEEIPMPKGSDTNEERGTAANLLEEKEATEPQADGDSEELDEVIPVDGRISGPPPSYDKPGDDPSADEAANQEREKGE